MQGSWFRGRPMPWRPDEQAIEQERQRWVYEKIQGVNDVITDLAVDPDQAYREHREAYVMTGDPVQLRWMLEYVQ